MSNKLIKTLCLAASVLALASCGGSNAAPAATLEKAFSSPAKLSYSNMRPQYNYYLTTFSFQTLEIYSDSSYVFTISSSTFSAVILPEEGNDAQGNERDNSMVKYYGSFTAVVDELDEDCVTYKLAKPTRIVGLIDAAYYYDTAAWTDTMKAKTADVEYTYDAATQTQKETGRKEYATGAEYLEAKAFESLEVEATLTKSSILYTTVK